MDYLLSILSGGISGAILVWLLKGLISERLKRSIQHEYAEKLESYKTELNSKIESIKHENQVSQLRTSLFFDHQREAFASLIAKIAQVNVKWMEHYDPEEGLYKPVPKTEYSEFKFLLYQHQLFLDEECLMALSLIDRVYTQSMPLKNYGGEYDSQGESGIHVSYIEYLQPRIASMFRNKIGVISDPQYLFEVAILSAIELVNDYHFPNMGIPPQGNLSTKKVINAADRVAKGVENIDELLILLRNFDAYLSQDGGWLQDGQLQVKRTLNLLTKYMVDEKIFQNE